VTDAAERVAQLTAGQADLITDLTLEQATTWDSAGGRLEAIESTRRIFIGLRVEEGTPLADKRVRQALNYAVDVQAIVNSLLGGYGQREAGYAQGFDLVLDTPTGHYHQDQAVAQAIAEQLGQVGINVEVRAHDWSSYVENYLLPRQMGPLFLLGLNSRGNEWEDTNNLSFAFPFNLSSWQNAEFERLLKEARTTFNERQRQTLLSQAQAIAYEEVPWIWLWREYNFYGVKSDLNWQPRADGLVYLYQSAGSTEP
jgi:peptide/nickel transport system substrate-binding protein